MTNPFNSTQPGHLFTGYDSLRTSVVEGLVNGISYAIMGGRRCGKTSFLLQLATDLDRRAPQSRSVLARHLDIQAEIPRSTVEFFQSIARRLVQDLEIAAWDGVTHGNQPYQSFLQYLAAITPRLNAAHGPDWHCVLFVDELEVSTGYLPNDECFQNLRHFLKRSDFASRFAFVIAGSTGLSELTTAGSALSNVLQPEMLRPLSGAEARRLMAHLSDSAVDSRVEEQLLTLTGGHPWMLQALLEQLWREREALNNESVTAAVRRFVRNRDDVFASWVHAIGASGQSAFSVLAEAGDKGLAHRELRNVIPRDTPVTRVLTILGYHGIVVEEADQRFHANGAIFRDWYTQNIGYVNDVPAPHAAPSPRATSDELRTRVFVVFGRDRKLYGAMIRFLRCLNLEPIEWNAALEATNNGAATVKDILEQALMMAQAVVVLLTPDDEARLRQPFHGPQEPPHETMLTPQPRPNVIFEAGFALAKFPTRTILVRFDKSTRLFSDIGGVFLLDLANDVNSRNDFIRRLKTVGLNVDDTGTDWQTKTAGGDFTPAI